MSTPKNTSKNRKLLVERTEGILSDGLFSILFLVEACGSRIVREQIINITKIGIIVIVHP